jgi:hypothetical protein
MSKTNVGAAYGAAFFFALAGAERKWQALAGYAAGAVGAAGLLTLIVGSPRAYMDQVFSAYGQAASRRLGRFSLKSNWLVNHYWIPFVVVSVNLGLHFDRWRDFGALLLLFNGITFAGIFAVHTGSMMPEANIPLWGIQMALALALVFKALDYGRTDALMRGFHKLSVAFLAAGALFLTALATRYGVELRTWTYISNHPEGDYALKAGPLKGWMCRRATGELVDQMVTYIGDNVPKEDSLLILADMQILYALTGRESYRGVPFIFDVRPGYELPVPGRQLEEVRKNVLADLPDWVLVHEGGQQLETDFFVQDIDSFLGLRDVLRAQYDRLMQWGPYVLLKRRA